MTIYGNKYMTQSSAKVDETGGNHGEHADKAVDYVAVH